MSNKEREKWKGTITLLGRCVEYTARISPRAKNSRLVIGIGTGLEIVLPATFNIHDLDRLLIKNQKWILDKLKGIHLRNKTNPSVISPTPERILFRGMEALIEIRHPWEGPSRVVVEANKIILFLPEESKWQAAEVLIRWLRQEARSSILNRVREISHCLKLKYNRVFIRDQKTRWGSCSTKQNLNFNWRLVMAPPGVLDYVVIHELMHLLEQNHSKRFWDLVENVCPDYKNHRSWLRENASRLSL